jgi:hypothetical protein
LRRGISETSRRGNWRKTRSFCTARVLPLSFSPGNPAQVHTRKDIEHRRSVGGDVSALRLDEHHSRRLGPVMRRVALLHVSPQLRSRPVGCGFHRPAAGWRSSRQHPGAERLKTMKKARPVLYWSKHGAIACEAHAPRTDLKRWVEERWRLVDYARRPLQCPHCHNGASVIRTARR